MSNKPDPARILNLLLVLVPGLPEDIRHKRHFPGIYDTVLGVIADYGSNDQREWSDLAQFIREQQSLLRAAA